MVQLALRVQQQMLTYRRQALSTLKMEPATDQAGANAFGTQNTVSAQQRNISSSRPDAHHVLNMHIKTIAKGLKKPPDIAAAGSGWQQDSGPC